MPDITRFTSHAGVQVLYHDLAKFNAAIHENGSLVVYVPHNGQYGILALHDEATPGGSYRTQLSPAGIPVYVSNTAPVPLTNVTSMCVQHDLGFYPLVQVLDDNGDLVDVDVNHTDTNEFCISSATPISGNIIFR